MHRAVTLAVLVVAAVIVASPLRAQVKSAADSLLRVRADSIARADSVTGALPQAEVPFLTEAGMSHRWNRDSLFSTGALTLADFLDRVPGLASLRARFYMGAQVGSYLGDAGRVRLFLDGIELDAIDPRSGGVVDLSLFPIGALEELVVERGANELRLHMRSWRGPLRLTAQTRADVLTGDNRSNTFRGYLARRARNGFAFQVMLQQRSTDDRRLGGDGDATTVFARAGLVRERWSLDGTLLRMRTTQQTLTLVAVREYELAGRPIPRYDQVQREAYLRFATGDQSRGPWLKVVAASRSNAENTPFGAASSTQRFLADSADTSRTSSQLVATAGWASAHAQVSATERLRRVDGRTLHQPSVRAGFDLGRLTGTAWAERNPFSEVTQADAFLKFLPAPRLALTGAVSYGTTGTLPLPADSSFTPAAVPLPVARAARGEVALRVGRLWLQGGAIVRDSAVLRAPRIFDRQTPWVAEGRATGLTWAVTGPLFKGFELHLNGVRWSDAGWYRPQLQARSELTWRYHWTGATKTGGFDFVLAGDVEYRTASRVPVYNSAGTVTPFPTFPATPLGIRAEFTLKDATITFQMRNLLNVPYTTVPGLLMPGPLAVYGVRWTFWN
ncbi:MAG: hypothetical protein IT355_03120 [Gemmatimonadaceae bacterium]|nr:hypothetical protein [Gemmatimonadaceae bacterium]